MILFGILLQLLSPQASANELTLHFIPSPKGVNWNKPQSLAFSVVRNQIARVNGGERHEIGHVYEELTCGTQHRFLGVTSVGNSEERNLIFKQGYGLGILFHEFKGQFDDEAEEAADIKAMQATGRSNFVRFVISDSTCGRLMDYLDEYAARGYDKTYAGLNARPLHGEGSGCSAFAASFLELSGLQIPEFETEWMSTRIVPWKFIGGPQTGNRVSILKLLLAFSARWASDESQGYLTHFWDPEKMFWWTKQLVSDLKNDVHRDLPWAMKSVTSDRSVGVEFDATLVPTPTGAIFY